MELKSINKVLGVIAVALSFNVLAFSVPQPPVEQAASKLAHIQYKAAQGEKEAQFLLGLMHLSGRFAEEDRPKGLYWVEQAAELGHAKAQQTLADITFEGKLVPRNLLTAERWYLVLSEGGSKWADFRLGFIYAAGGELVERNCGKAVQYFNSVGDEVSLGNVAWILSTCPEEQYRNGSRALELAQSLVDGNADDPTHLDNLAAAYAEIGDFSLAISTQIKAIEALKLSEQLDRSDEFEERLQTYQEHKPYREVIPLLP